MPIEIFNNYAKEYDQWFEDHQAEFLDELSRIKDVIDPTATPILEIGVGTGRFSEKLNIMYGLEPSGSMGLIAKNRGISIIRGLGEAIPVKASTFRTVVMITVICFLDNPKETFQEVYRILAEDGTLIVAFIEKEGFIAERYLSKPEKGGFLSHATFYSLKGINKCLNHAGFSLISSTCRLGFCVLKLRRRTT